MLDARAIDDIEIEFLKAEVPSDQFSLGVTHVEQALKGMVRTVNRMHSRYDRKSVTVDPLREIRGVSCRS